MNLEHSHLEATEVEDSTNQPVDYEAPTVESVMTPEALEREVLYAGVPLPSGVQKT